MERPGVKRKHGVEKKIVMFCNSFFGTKCAAIFEFSIKVTTSYKIQSEYNKGQVIHPIEIFYDQYIREKYTDPIIRSVGACISGSELYLFPDDCGEREMYHEGMFVPKSLNIKPLVYNILKKTNNNNNNNNLTCSRDLSVLPEARKMGPIVVLVGREIFVLSAFYNPLYKIPEPSFEALDLDKCTWRNLTYCPINNFDRLSYPNIYSIQGYAVLLLEDLLLVSLSCGFQEIIYYTYNFRSNVWKDTNAPVFMDDVTVECGHGPWLYNQALVVGHDIYTYYPETLELIVFSYTERNEWFVADYDILLGPATVIQAFEFHEEPFRLSEPDFVPSTAITKVEDDLFCLFHTTSPSWSDLSIMKVHVYFIQLLARDRCEIIMSSTYNLFVGKELYGLSFGSCHVMDAVTSDQDHGKRAYNEVDDKATVLEMDRDCGGT